MLNRIGSLKIANRRSHVRAMSTTIYPSGAWQLADEKPKKVNKINRPQKSDSAPELGKVLANLNTQFSGRGRGAKHQVFHAQKSVPKEMFKSDISKSTINYFPEDITELELSLEDRCANYLSYCNSAIWPKEAPKFTGKRANLDPIIPLNALDHLQIPKYPEVPEMYKKDIKRSLSTKQLDTLQGIYKTLYEAEEYEYQHAIDDVSFLCPGVTG